jgi:hypothetical protein
MVQQGQLSRYVPGIDLNKFLTESVLPQTEYAGMKVVKIVSGMDDSDDPNIENDQTRRFLSLDCLLAKTEDGLKPFG